MKEDFFQSEASLYFTGHSLGLMPQRAHEKVNEVLKDWEHLGVEGHFKARQAWFPYHEFLTPAMAKVVGAKAEEVVVMNSLTVNLHLMLASFYRPTQKRYKILIENNTFPSDQYAVQSQVRWHGFKDGVVELQADQGMTISEEKILETIESHKDELSLVLLGQVNYLSGQAFPMKKIIDLCRSYDIKVGFNLAHGAGNLHLKLHEWAPDFAVWCGYKYLNGGPGAPAGAFVAQRHLGSDLPRLEGWWGTDKENRFLMKPEFEPIPTAEAWQLSNPPILAMAGLLSSLEIFHELEMESYRQEADELTTYLEEKLKEHCPVEIVTPKSRGSMLCFKIQGDGKKVQAKLEEKKILVDFREPDIIRMTPVALYNTKNEINQFVEILKEILT